MTEQLNDKWVLLTGASRGVGRQIAYALSDIGCKLILHSRKNTHTDEMAIIFRMKGCTVFQLEAELSDASQVAALGQAALDISGGIDILYNVAAIMTKYHEDIFTTVKDEYELSFMVNTIAPVTLCNMMLPYMIRRKYGRIVNVTSGIRNEPQLMAYAASKAALDKYVYDMAPHLKGTGVAMNLLDPGWCRTDLGGANAPNPVESVIPGALVPLMQEDDVCGKWFNAQDYVK